MFEQDHRLGSPTWEGGERRRLDQRLQGIGRPGIVHPLGQGVGLGEEGIEAEPVHRRDRRLLVAGDAGQRLEVGPEPVEVHAHHALRSREQRRWAEVEIPGDPRQLRIVEVEPACVPAAGADVLDPALEPTVLLAQADDRADRKP
jgi:hypothetical protein